MMLLWLIDAVWKLRIKALSDNLTPPFLALLLVT